MHDLAESLREVGAKVDICSSLGESPEDTDVVIFDKGLEPVRGTGSLVGCINPAVEKKFDVDFVIVGSIEEKISLSFYKNVVIVPLIERSLSGTPLRHHEDCAALNVLYHGNDEHLDEFKSSGLTAALESFGAELRDEGRALNITVVAQSHHQKKKLVIPNASIFYYKYSFQNFQEHLYRQDIGIVPSAYYLKPNKIASRFNFMLGRNYRGDDFVTRFKNKTNAGRLMVLMQSSIPAVADLTPSHASIVRDGYNGFLAANKNSWVNALRSLQHAWVRNLISAQAKADADEQFGPQKEARKLLDRLSAMI